MDYSSTIKKATKWSSATEILAKLITPIVNMVLARLLVPEAFGVVATITMVISFAEIFTDAGFQKYIVQHEFETQEELDKSTNVAFWSNFVISICICLIIFFFRDAIAVLVGNPGLGDSISIASLLILLAAFSSIQTARYKRDFDFKTLFFVRIGSALIPLVVTIPLALLLRNYWALLIGTMITQMFSAVFLTAKSKWRPSFYYSFRRLREMFSFTGWTLLESVSIWMTNYIDVFIVGSLLSTYYLGLYRTAITSVNSYMAVITSAVLPVLFSALSRYQNNEEKFRDTYYTFQKMTAMLIIPMGIGLLMYSDLVTLILLGNQWTEASQFVGLWGLTSTITIVFSYFSSTVYRSKGKPQISLFSQLIHLLFIIPTLLIATPYGFQTLCVSRAFIRLQSVLLDIIIISSLFHIRFMDSIRNIWPTVVATVIMAAIAAILRQVSSNVFWEISSVLICIVVYAGAMLLIPAGRRQVAEIPVLRKLLKLK